MDAILLFSHGSVLCGAEQNLLELAARMRERGDAPIVETGFLNYTEPLFAEAVQRCVDQGATRILVAPYFLIAGKFVVHDLPKVIDAAREAHPDVEIITAGVIGSHPALVDAILASAAEAQRPSAWREQLPAPNPSCHENPKCPAYGSPTCRAHTEVHA